MHFNKSITNKIIFVTHHIIKIDKMVNKIYKMQQVKNNLKKK